MKRASFLGNPVSYWVVYGIESRFGQTHKVTCKEASWHLSKSYKRNKQVLQLEHYDRPPNGRTDRVIGMLHFLKFSRDREEDNKTDVKL